MIDTTELLPETWRRVFSYCDAEVVGRFLLASYRSDSQLHLIAREMAISNLDASLSAFFDQDESHRICREDKLKCFAKYVWSRGSAQSGGSSSISTSQALKCCVLWAYIDRMIALNRMRQSNRKNDDIFLWTIATGPLMADFYEPGNVDDSSHAELMEVHISTPLHWDPANITNVNAWMRRGVHTNMYVTPFFSEDSVQDCIGVVTQVDSDRDIHSCSFVHGDLGDQRWSHALVLGGDGQNRMNIWVKMHPRMESHSRDKFEEYVWMLEDVKTKTHKFICTWQQTTNSCYSIDYDGVIDALKEILVKLKQCR